MSLARHVDSDEIIKNLHDMHMKDAGKKHVHTKGGTSHITPMVHQQTLPNLNLASFVGTYMETHAEQLMFENISKNMSDADEYPAMMQMHSRCVSIIANLWGARKGEKAIGSATTGSSEAIHLGGLAMKRRWQEKREDEGKDKSKPNIIMGSNAQVALEKFARYFEVEARILPVSEKSNYRLDPELVKENIDENTIGIFVILGSTYTGHYEPVEEISKILDDYEAKTGVDIPIHVDAASGGFVAPFTHAKPVAQDGTSNSHESNPLIHPVTSSVLYTQVSDGSSGATNPTFQTPRLRAPLSRWNRRIIYPQLFSARCSSEHTFKGTDAPVFSKEDETSADYNAGLPVVAFRFSDEFKKEFPHLKQETVSNLLRAKQYIIPNYPLPPNEEKTEILRVVVRESMSFDLLDRLISDICATTQTLIDSDEQDFEYIEHSSEQGAWKCREGTWHCGKETWEGTG
ncbi:hypothetical protein DID88_005490 [Monilinia fructigena]|uniref:glutamate decarboxylase n=1 Tax=Monilinia fructigena TaxID=38457 RepID=A0A395IZY5_9HELO|nr:hypothetical protein DID88_005490 [Monilinia fructigena]